MSDWLKRITRRSQKAQESQELPPTEEQPSFAVEPLLYARRSIYDGRYPFSWLSRSNTITAPVYRGNDLTGRSQTVGARLSSVIDSRRDQYRNFNKEARRDQGSLDGDSEDERLPRGFGLYHPNTSHTGATLGMGTFGREAEDSDWRPVDGPRASGSHGSPAAEPFCESNDLAQFYRPRATVESSKSSISPPLPECEGSSGVHSRFPLTCEPHSPEEEYPRSNQLAFAVAVDGGDLPYPQPAQPSTIAANLKYKKLPRIPASPKPRLRLALSTDRVSTASRNAVDQFVDTNRDTFNPAFDPQRIGWTYHTRFSKLEDAAPSVAAPEVHPSVLGEEEFPISNDIIPIAFVATPTVKEEKSINIRSAKEWVRRASTASNQSSDMVFTHTALDAPVTERMPRTLDEENEDTSVRKDSESSHSTTTDAIISDEEQSDAEPRERWTKFVTLSPEQFGRFKMRASSRPIYGGFSDVWRCDAKFADGKLIQVAVKKFRTIRIAHDADESTIAHKLLKRLTKELRIWMALKHPNISPLLGFVLSGDMCMISPWHSHGDVEAYIRRHPTTDRMKLVYEVACGLAYLHNQTYPVVHGDMKPNNVLVDARGVAVIIDFGLSSVIESDPTLSASFTTESLQEAGCARWMAPELLMVEKCKRSPPTDVYSFGSVALYIYTSQLPFKDILNLQIIYALIKGQTPAATRDGYPALQNGRADWFNNLLDSCWSTQSELRPTMANLEKIIDSKRQNWGV